MHLQVDHTTRYTFSSPVRFVVQSLKLMPSRSACQVPLSWEVSADGCDISAPFINGYGDFIQTLTHPDECTEIEIKVRGEVETSDTGGVLRDHGETIAPQVFLRHTPMTMPDSAIEFLARQAGKDIPPLELAHNLSTAVSDAVEYVPGISDAHTTASETLAEGRGVCQDHAHVLIAAARHRGVPARYVSGYLCANATGGQHEASHAWAELYLEGIGWVGFDPSNRVCPTEYYIRLGAGLDARDAAPIRGVHSGGADEALAVSVVVQEAQQQ